MDELAMAGQERANQGLHEHVIRQARQLLADRAAPVVDLGCGSGALLRRLRSAGFSNLVGIDIAPPPAEPGIQFHAADLDQPRLPLATGSVSLLVAVEVIEHMENPGLVLAEIRRVLAGNGRALLTTPNVHSIEARLRMLLLGSLKQFDALGDPTHITPIFRFPFAALAARHGLSIARSWGFPENGDSPTSRQSLRRIGGLARTFGVRGDPDGDQLCMVLEPVEHDAAGTALQKAAALTAHYQVK